MGYERQAEISRGKLIYTDWLYDDYGAAAPPLCGGPARVLVFLLAALALLLAAPAALARDASIRSFDGTRIVLSFFPAAGLTPPQKAPTVLVGPGWSSGRDTNPNSESSDQFGTMGLGPLRRAGYNVLTWDPRGFGQSGGTVQVNSPQYEGRDVQKLIDYVARQPEARLDGPRDPRVGMAGGSYGGGIQLVTAAIDQRVDAIAPDIAWHSLVTSLYKDQSPKSGWGTILFALGVQGSVLPGLVSGETGNLDPHITSAFASAATTGKISDEDVRWFASRGPGALVNRIRAPTLLIQGTVDTLFTLDEAIRNYAILRRNGVPTKMIWFCGGHGACFTDAGPSGFTERASLTWLRRYLKRDLTVKTGPRFQWIADDGRVRNAADYPLPLLGRTSGTGSGVLAFAPDPGTSGTPLAATPGANAVRVPIRKPAAGRQLLGEPRLTITYSGTATTKDVLLYAQIVDLKRGVVVGNVVRPVPLVADGLRHTVTRPLENIAASVQADSSYELQIVPSTSVYGPQRAAGAITMSSIRITVPVVASGSSADD